jgi:hypothetical protein
MDAATINSKIYAGRGKAAQRIGLDCRIYRPLTAATPFPSILATIKAAFNAGDNKYSKSNEFNDPIWYGDFDGSVTLPGDYMVRVVDGQIYYIAGQQQLLPILCIDCNRTLKISRTVQQSQVGAINYGGKIPFNQVEILGVTTLWPASILFGGRRESTGAGLPADVGNTGYIMKLPPSVPVTIMAGDTVTDDLNRRYLIEGAELSDLGWRLICNEVHL